MGSKVKLATFLSLGASLRNDAGPLSGLQRNALASLVHFVTNTTKPTRDASALRWRPERGPASFRSEVRFLRLSNQVLFVYFFSSISTRNEVFSETFPPSFCSFLGGFQLSKCNSFHLQIRYHTADDVLIASNEIASATHLPTRHHTANKRVHR